MIYFFLTSRMRTRGWVACILFAILFHSQFFVNGQEQNRDFLHLNDPFQPLSSLENEPETPWDPRPQRIRPPSVGNRGAIRIPTPSRGFQVGRPDFNYESNKLRTGKSTPIKRKIFPLPSNHPNVANRKYNPVTKRTAYVPVRLDYDHETDMAIAELNRLNDIQKRNGKNETLSQFIEKAKINIKKAKMNAVAAGNYYINGVHIDKFFPEKDFPDPENLVMKSLVPNE